MSDIKNLFGKNKNTQVLSDSSLQKEGAKIESVDYLKSNLKQKTPLYSLYRLLFSF
jgi:hypothetical protein